MYNNYALLKFKKLLDSIYIDIQYMLWDEEPKIKDEYFTKEFTDGIETEELGPVEDKVFTSNIYVKRELIWSFGYNGSPDNPFFKEYSSLEKDLFEEMDLNRKIVKDLDEVDSLYGDLCNWLNDKIDRIQYKPEKDTFECDFVNYGNNLNKITFKGRYNSNIQEFFKELKNRLMQTYSKVLEKIPLPTFNPNLKWNKDKVDLLELMAALVESESLTINSTPVTKDYMAELLSRVFVDVDLTNFHKDLSQATKRKRDKTPYLKLLVKTFEDYANKNKKSSK